MSKAKETKTAKPVTISVDAALTQQAERLTQEKDLLKQAADAITAPYSPTAADLVVDHLDPSAAKIAFLEMVSEHLDWEEALSQEDHRRFTQGFSCILKDVLDSVSLSAETLRDAELA